MITNPNDKSMRENIIKILSKKAIVKVKVKVGFKFVFQCSIYVNKSGIENKKRNKKRKN